MKPIDAETLLALHALYAAMSAALDQRELAGWPDLFTEDAVYRVQSRENHARGLPLALMAFESRGMLKDRVHAALETIYHDPYAQRHITGLPRLLDRDGDALCCETPLLVVRTRRDAMPEILLVGRTLDRVVPTREGLRFARREVIYDNDLLPNSLIDPV